MGAFRAVLKLTELPAGSMRAVSLDGRELLLCHTREGVFALDNLCTHAEARLCEGRLRATRLLCPLHGGAFDVRDGRVLAGAGAAATRQLPGAHRAGAHRGRALVGRGLCAAHQPGGRQRHAGADEKGRRRSPGARTGRPR